MFGRMKYWSAKCFFCGLEGPCIAAPNLEGREITICPLCANKLIVGIDVGMRELQRLEAEKNKPVLDGIDIVSAGPENAPSDAVST